MNVTTVFGHMGEYKLYTALDFNSSCREYDLMLKNEFKSIPTSYLRIDKEEGTKS